MRTPNTSLMLGKSCKFLLVTYYTNNILNRYVCSIYHKYRWFKSFNEKLPSEKKTFHVAYFLLSLFFRDQSNSWNWIFCSESNAFSVALKFWNIFYFISFPLREVFIALYSVENIYCFLADLETRARRL